MHKYRNKPCEVDGQKYRSKAEAEHHAYLLMLERCGKISGLRREVPYILAPAVVLGGRKKPALRYYADFVFNEDGEQRVQDVKGKVTPLFRAKKHLMASVHGIEVEVVK